MPISTDAVWSKQIQLMVFAQFIIILTLDMSDPYWPLILSSLHAFDQRRLQYWSGAIYMAPFLLTIFTTLLWTKMGERIGYKKMVLRAGIALMGTQWSLLFLHNPWVIFSIRLLQGALAGFTAAAQAWSLAITPKRVHSHILGRLQAATAMGSIIGPVCGGIVAHYCGYLAIFTLSGWVCLLITSFLAAYLEENSKNIQCSKEKKQKKIFHEKRRNVLLLLICSSQALRWMPTPFFALYVVQRLHANNITLGFIYAMIAVTMSLTSLNFGRIIDNKLSYPLTRVFLISALMLSALVQCGFAFATRTYFAVVLGSIWGIGLGLISLILFTFLLKGINDNIRASVVGLGNTALKLGNLLGIIVGTLVQAEGYFMLSFMVIAGLYFVLAALANYYK
jgi:MFS transporter, DHA1 family, staphyloferrin B biosynthesis exporter